MKRMSREKFMLAMDGKHVSCIASCVVGKEVFEKALKSLEEPTKYHKVTTTPIDDYYTGVFHKCSKSFYREKADGTKSYKYFNKGDYILSDGKLSFIITPSTMRVNVYRTED